MYVCTTLERIVIYNVQTAASGFTLCEVYLDEKVPLLQVVVLLTR